MPAVSRPILSLLLPAFILLAAWNSPSIAHDPGLSSARITIGRQHISAEVTFSRKEIGDLFAGDGTDDLESLLQSKADEILTVSDHPPGEKQVILDENDNAIFRLEWRRGITGPISIRSPLISKLPLGHRQYCIVRNHSRELITHQFLTAAADSVILDHPSPAVEEEPPLPNRDFLRRLWMLLALISPLAICYFLARPLRDLIINKRRLDARHHQQRAAEY